MSALRIGRWDGEAALILLAKYKNWLLVIAIVQIVVGFFSYALWEGTINGELVALYILMWAVPLFLAHQNSDKLDTINPGQPVGVFSRIKYYMMFGIGSAILFYYLSGAGHIEAGTIYKPYALGTFIYTVAIVSPSESIFFQGVVPSVLKSQFDKDGRFSGWELLLTFIISQGLFALAHYAAYSSHVNSGQLMFTSFLFGCLFLSIAWFSGYGLTAAMGVHSAWNWVILSGGGVVDMSVGTIAGACVVIAITTAIIYFKVFKSSKTENQIHGGIPA